MIHSHRLITTLIVMIVLAIASQVSNASLIALQTIGADVIHQSLPTIDGIDDVTGQAQRIVILDSGIDYDHPGLGDRVIGGINYASGADYASTSPTAYNDQSGHGTFVTGVIGSTLNGVPGIAPNVEFLSVRVLASNGQGSFNDMLNGLRWVNANATAMNITAVNISIGATTTYDNPEDVPYYSITQKMKEEIDKLIARNVVVVVAAGNGSSTTGLSLPAIFDNVVSVGASSIDDMVRDQSNRNDDLELLAPGESIKSLWKDGQSAIGSGTSYATPFVTAASVLIREYIEKFDDDLAGSYDNYQQRFVDLMQITGHEIDDPASGLTFSRLDIEAAFVNLAMEYGQPLDVPEPATIAIMSFGVGIVVTRRKRTVRK